MIRKHAMGFGRIPDDGFRNGCERAVQRQHAAFR
jgi:hypothetical protein